ncbi:MAG: hypothetical protein ACP5KE_02000 [Candidatus Methanodesulfokora sp.]|jgi:succinate dehydrogenase hydrophobic anchor subunit|nr:MAG: hypothetical protein C0200_00525 [Candidatus Korarchaeota archaeon]
MKESNLMILHYATALILIVTGSIHLMANNIPDIGIHGPLYLANMLIFVSALMYHAMNGVRVILIELVPTRSRAISYIILVIGVIAYLYIVSLVITLVR